MVRIIFNWDPALIFEQDVLLNSILKLQFLPDRKYTERLLKRPVVLALLSSVEMNFVFQ
jgi:hypothetical protein